MSLNKSIEKFEIKLFILVIWNKYFHTCYFWLILECDEPNTVVTSANASFGLRVTRGKDWSWENQDRLDSTSTIKGQSGNDLKNEGTIIQIRSDNWARVIWDSGIQNVYRIGAEEKFDLLRNKKGIVLYKVENHAAHCYI